MNFIKIFNIVPPEEIKFIFPGKIGRNFSSWQNGEWIVTTKRIIFLAEKFDLENKPLYEHLLNKFIIVLKEEITEVIKKKTKLIVKYSTYIDGLNRYDTKKFSMGFLNYNFRNYNVKYRTDLINTIHLYLIASKSKGNAQGTCPRCGAGIPANETECLNCESDFKRCEICHYLILEREEKTSCPICKSDFHKREFLEWIKTHGQCPYCHYQLNHHALLEAEPARISRPNPRLVV